jgi:L-lactate dehydrogenase (cytochrome)/(S)-mandelate dehydrogenase
MKLDRALNIEDLRRIARRRLPRVAFDYLDGGVEDEACLARNRAAFERYRLVPRYLVDVSTRDQSATLFGRTWASPFGIAPTGLAGFLRRGGDEALARAAVAANIPFVLSGSSNASIEAIARWRRSMPVQLAARSGITHDMIRRAHDAGLETLVMTSTCRCARNASATCARLRCVSQADRAAADMLLPAWLAAIARTDSALRQLGDLRRRGGARARRRRIPELAVPGAPDLAGSRTARRLWPGSWWSRILHPDDARLAAEAKPTASSCPTTAAAARRRAVALEAFPRFATRSAIGSS